MEIVFFIVGTLFATIGGFVFWDARRFAATAVKGEGRVLGFTVNESTSRKSGKQTTYNPVIGYHHQGKDYQFTGRIGSSQVRHRINDKVTILISPRDPAIARLAGPGMQIFGAIFFSIGLAAMVVFFLVFDFSVLSLGIAGIVLLLIVAQAFVKLRKHDIHSLEDIKRTVTAAKRAHQRGEGDETKTMITDPAAFERERKRRRAPVWVLALFLLIGLGILIGGGFAAKQRGEFLAAAHTISGKVIDFKRRTSTSDGKTTTTYYPIVRYQPPEHPRAVTFEHDTGSSSPGYRRGDAVTVLYSPNDPRQAIIDAGLMNWFGPALMIALGAIFALVGGLSLVKRLRKPTSATPEVKLDF